mmetsp:Transcript_71285/g.200817  ORF Transcript_71285/g.200817 Transcript_71285/m.200817 type:complete len:589 (-) Transcript_71285:158-1924(-)
MLGRGVRYFEELVEETAAKGDSKVIQGKEAFFMYDSLGFPLDLTELMAEEAGFSVDSDGFAAEMQAQKDRSRLAAQLQKQVGDGAPLVLQAEETAWLAARSLPPTDDAEKYAWDVTAAASVQAIFTADGFLEAGKAASAATGAVGVVLDRSAFYAEAGGQVADQGELKVMDSEGNVAATVAVHDVQVYAGYVLHLGTVTSGEVKDADSVVPAVDYERRKKVVPNHTITHVLNHALRQVLGGDVAQKGSLVNDDKLRFDFSHNKALTPKQLSEVERLVQESIGEALPVFSEVLPLQEAQQISGLQAVFGEVYPDPVRVISVGHDINDIRNDLENEQWATRSIEFCGGQHLSNTADAECFALVEETAVAKGVRRIVAVTRDSARQAAAIGCELADAASALGGMTASDLEDRTAELRKELEEKGPLISAIKRTEVRAGLEASQKKIAAEKKKVLDATIAAGIGHMEAEVKAAVARGDSFVVLDVKLGVDSKAVKKATKILNKEAKTTAILCLSEEDPGSGGKLLCFAVVPETMQKAGLAANEWVNAALGECGGRGGGKSDAAQGQAPSSAKIAAARATAEEVAKGVLVGSP